MVYLVIIGRLLIVLLLFWTVAVLMGKRHIGELSILDFIVAVTLGAVAGADIADPKVPHLPTLLAIILLGLFHYFLTRVLLKRREFARWVTFDPTVVMQNGIILKDNLAKIRYTVDELLSHLRGKGIFDLQEVEFAVLEPNGTLSVQKKSQHRPATPKDLGLATSYQGLSVPLILEGRINREALNFTGLTEDWLIGEIHRSGYTGPQEVFLGMLNTQGGLYLSPQEPPFPPQRLDQ